MMLAKAAAAAAHASRLSWLAGRAWDEENAQTVECAAEAVHIALRIAQLDVAALAEEVVPKGGAPLTPLRTPSFPGANRILRALPT